MLKATSNTGPMSDMFGAPDVSTPADLAERILALLSHRAQLPPAARQRARAAAAERIDRTLLDLGLVPEEAMAADTADILEGDAERLRDLANDGPVVRQVGDLVQKALSLRATDIHVEPMADRLVIRYRVDGLLSETETLPRRDAAGLVSRLKVTAGLDIDERRLPQAGRIRQTYGGRDIDFRLTTVPTVHGEDVVLRVLDQAGGEGGGLTLLRLRRQPAVRLGLDHWLLRRTGPLGRLIRDAGVTLYTRTLAALLGGGVPLADALSTVSLCLRNRALAHALQDLANLLERERATALDRFLALLVPGLTLVLGSLTGTIFAALISGIISINDIAV